MPNPNRIQKKMQADCNTEHGKIRYTTTNSEEAVGRAKLSLVFRIIIGRFGVYFKMNSDDESDFDNFGDSISDIASGDSASSDFSESESSDGSDSSDDGGPNLGLLVRPWIAIPDLQTDIMPAHTFQYNGDSGVVAANFRPDMKPVDYFSNLMTDGILQEIVDETNRYAKEKVMRNTPLRRKSRYAEWNGTDLEEMKAFLGIIVNMGLVQKTCLNAYWDSSNPSQSTPYFRHVFRRDRFLLLLAMFNMPTMECDATNIFTDSEKRAYSLIHRVGETSQQNYIMKEAVSVDESLVGFMGRYRGIQYMPNKHHHKFGVKMWLLCEADTGYAYHMIMYTGRRPGQPRQDNQGYKVVMGLMDPILDRGHHLFVDNFFSSPKLFRDLYDRKTFATGTCRSNRMGLPDSIKRKLAKGSAAASRSGPLLSVGFHDKKHVIILSTVASANMKDVTSRRGRARHIPHGIELYNKSMGGVDLSDMRLYCFLDERKTWKWTKKLFFNVIGRMTLNAYILYKDHVTKAGIKPMERRIFQVKLVEGLVGNVTAPAISKGGRPPSNPIAAGVRLNNPRSHLKQTKLAKGKRRNCVICTDHQARPTPKRVRTSYICQTCDVALCLGPCWEQYHTKQNL